jgi:hypothetical protein
MMSTKRRERLPAPSSGAFEEEEEEEEEEEDHAVWVSDVFAWRAGPASCSALIMPVGGADKGRATGALEPSR